MQHETGTVQLPHPALESQITQSKANGCCCTLRVVPGKTRTRWRISLDKATRREGEGMQAAVLKPDIPNFIIVLTSKS